MAVPTRALLALRGIDAGTWVAVAALFAGWFLLGTLRVGLGVSTQRIQFFHLPEIAVHPTRLLWNTDSTSGITTWISALLCLVALAAPIATRLARRPFDPLGNFAPLALMVAVGVLMFLRFVADGGAEHRPDTFASDVRHLFDHAYQGAGNVMARRVSVQLGAYLSLLASAYLAWRGYRSFKSSTTPAGDA